MSKDSPVSPNCQSLQTALAVIGDRWSALLIRELTECPKKFSELEESLPGISPRTLSQRLDMLVTEKILEKAEYCLHPPRYNYVLTKKGLELKAVLGKMSEWGARYS